MFCRSYGRELTDNTTLIDFALAVSGNMKDTEGKLIKKW